MAKVTGIGGVFIKSSGDKEALAEWYQKNLGMNFEDFGGAIFNWKDDHSNDGGLTVWHTSDKDSEWFSPSQSAFMINYRIDDMVGMVEQLKTNGVELIAGPESHENGKFAWIMDPEGNKVELWQPMAWDERNKQL